MLTGRMARAIEPGEVVIVGDAVIGGFRTQAVVIENERAADAIKRLQAAIGKARGRYQLAQLAADLVTACEVRDMEGREARLLTVKLPSVPRGKRNRTWLVGFAHNDMVTFCRLATAEEQAA